MFCYTAWLLYAIENGRTIRRTSQVLSGSSGAKVVVTSAVLRMAQGQL